ncbi:MAG: hypothetical protein J6R30_04740 [Bacteroidales bacterium]|nr:hypothetical protein [Bacteroidales bacterium]
MKNRLWDIASTTFFSLLAILFVGVFITSLGKNAIDMFVRVGWDWRHTGNYVGLIAGFAAYTLFLIILTILKSRHNLDWFMKFTHELTHTLVALIFFRKIHEFVVRGRECFVYYDPPTIGYIPITLSPYCIPIYTLMIFPFRFAGDSHYMIIFDALIAFTYAFHVHTFIKQTRFTQNDIENCGIAQSVSFISFVHLAMLSLILATPKGGVLKALGRVFWEYPWQILTDPSGWVHEIIKYF